MARRPYGWVASFMAMASPCEVHLSGADRRTTERVGRAVADEAWRIEDKFSRYRDDNVVARINGAGGRGVAVDEETARLLTYASTLHELSGGRFDVTSGVLRRVWRFDGSDRVPSRRAVRAVLSNVGWHRVRWEAPMLTMAGGMEIDFGGIGKEYAVDRAAAITSSIWPNTLINFGGDLLAVGPHGDASPWVVGVEEVENPGAAAKRIALARGALATSGDARRFLLRDGKRYSHILDPTTGWPVDGAPRAVTVAAPTCTLAGMLATFALLHGPDAEAFLDAQQVDYWCRP